MLGNVCMNVKKDLKNKVGLKCNFKTECSNSKNNYKNENTHFV